MKNHKIGSVPSVITPMKSLSDITTPNWSITDYRECEALACRLMFTSQFTFCIFRPFQIHKDGPLYSTVECYSSGRMLDGMVECEPPAGRQ